ncbi:hypothetical protein CRUP_015105 [Coryphaenoides rupestris]|nr:hypothetical protein CRUP_015105 [Coryphaenoides rupestris]
MSQEKVYDPLDTTLTFINEPDDIDPYQDESPRAKMSCGHAVTPESLTGYCRSLLDQGHTRFRCPAQQGGAECGAEWSYPEIRRLAALTEEEMKHFEETLARLTASLFYDAKACPGCGTVVERQTLDNLCFSCPVCVGTNKPTTHFCWQCLKPWKGKAPSTTCCANHGCVNPDVELLRTCGTVVLSKVKGVEPCPSIRACPTCGLKVEHDGTGCKNIVCPRCRLEFCFVCLKLKTQCLQTSSYFIAQNALTDTVNLKTPHDGGTVVLSEVKGPCPSIWACPTCGMKVEHDGTGCKNVLCPRCKLEFCFVCLKLARQCLQTSSYFIACSSGMAPRQTAIPKWRQASPPS